VNSEHIQTGTVRAYLLRTLPDDSAEAIEERYFTDGAFFKELRAAEVELICDYLDGRLNESERAQFESRYLQVPQLRQLVADVRSRRGVRRRGDRRVMLRIALAGALGCLAILGMTILLRHGKTSPPVRIGSVEPPAPGLSLVLTPGITKGPGSAMYVLTPPHLPLTGSVFLELELPGQVSSATYTARLLNPDIEGSHRVVWTARGVRSAPKHGGQEVTVKLPPSSIAPGDYILELEMEGSHTKETYLFRVNSPQ
jgi:hypothetical protein